MKGAVIRVVLVFFVTTVCSSALAMDHMYELLAERDVAGLTAMDVGGKRAEVNEVLDLIAAQVARTGGATLEVGTNCVDRFSFPPVDFDMDGTPDELGSMLEVSFVDDVAFLTATDPIHGLALPWTIAAYTDGEFINVVIGVPETFTRLFFRGEDNLDGLVGHATSDHGRIRRIVDRALSGSEGFTTGLNLGLDYPEMDEDNIAAIESVVAPITPEFVSPVATISGYTVDEVVAALEAAFNAQTTSSPAWLTRRWLISEAMPRSTSIPSLACE